MCDFRQHVPHCCFVVCPLNAPVSLPPGLEPAEQPPVSEWGANGRTVVFFPNLGDVGEWAAPPPLCVAPFPCILMPLPLPSQLADALAQLLPVSVSPDCGRLEWSCCVLLSPLPPPPPPRARQHGPRTRLPFPRALPPFARLWYPPGLTLPEQPPVSVGGGSLCCGSPTWEGMGGWAAPLPLCVAPFPHVPACLCAPGTPMLPGRCGDPVCSALPQLLPVSVAL